MAAGLGVPLTFPHLNEMPPNVAAVVTESGSPVVLARVAGGSLAVALSPPELDDLGGSIEAFSSALSPATQQRGWSLRS